MGGVVCASDYDRIVMSALMCNRRAVGSDITMGIPMRGKYASRSITPGVGTIFVALLRAIYRRFTRISIRHVPGPPSTSFFLGNMREFHHRQVAEADFKWQAEYGDVVRFKAAFGEDRLLVMDPKAAQYIYQTAGYHFPKPDERREMSRIISGSGILSADEDAHKRHRKVLLPGFGGPESKAFWPIFYGYAAKLSSKWKDLISTSPNQEVVVDVPLWASRAMLDAIGEAAFDYQFGAMEDANNPLSKAYFSLLAKTFGALTDSAIFVQNLWMYFPPSWLRFISKFSPGLTLEYARHTEKIATDVARELVNSKSEALLQGKGSRDIMSLLVRANNSENEKTKLTDQELYAQMRTIMLAGHETTANTLSWALYELCRHPEMQHRLRAEIWEKERELNARGQAVFEVNDLDSMPYLQAVVKEVLRYHPVAPLTHRQAGRDDVLPLMKPIRSTTGEMLNEIPIPKGQRIAISIAGYNRNKVIFGEDAHTFNPDRWLHTSKRPAVNVGVYANLLTFAGGLRACIGFRFALIEFQAFLVELVGTYEFSLTPEAQKIRREPCGVMAPVIEGRQSRKEASLPLRVALASKDQV